jgi:glutathione S-transferase
MRSRTFRRLPWHSSPRVLAILEAQASGHTWIVGKKRTIIDAYATPILNWAAANLKNGLDPFPALKAHRERMLQDHAVAKVMRDEGSGE